ncbi:MAG: 2,3-bisphosphoglycerate-independent phosphoglycerate mutase (EC [uncultured Campylobacterales bacterium]|uniref:2,3-bisphosphoglycerate-independent phosphoglycerate mutase n=1 Tax=uncultured Campylobacterales bacterium TaxID=352960 RepID=A0A6S6SJR2_9BACT|nr:MAG: 2,3-bisphosphoglycerate-independent phosphoglycerate mutase (EC [uncultured Campylobacterales bacterium]
MDKQIVGKKVILIVTDGIGYNNNHKFNAFENAKTPTYDYLFKNVANTLIGTSGQSVGLPDGQMGNSEVGHMSMGSGRVIYQNLVKINKAIKEDTLSSNPAYKKLLSTSSDTIHLIGLFSDGGVHSHMNHIIELDKITKKTGKKVCVHIITDGRDTAVKESLKYIKNNPNLNICTLGGRYYAMDRDNRWDRIQTAYEEIVNAKTKTDLSPEQYIEKSYEMDVTDEFINPISFDHYDGMNSNDGVIFVNFRNDRMRQFTQSLGLKNFDKFKRKFIKTNIITMTQYDVRFPFDVMFAPEIITNTLAEVVSNEGLTQLHTAETEKYPHVTFYFNGGIEKPYKNEQRILIPSPNVKSYDLLPEMSAKEVCDAVLEGMNGAKDLIVVNFANGDMVGHTGNYEASVKAVEFIDTQIKRILDTSEKEDYSVVLTSDHGNCEEMVDEHGIKLTNHTLYDVFCFVKDKRVKFLNSGTLANVAPTVLELMGIETPEEMEKSLIKKI